MDRMKSLAIIALVVAAALWSYHARKSVAPSVPGETIVNVHVPELSTIAQDGKRLFDANCAICHGKDAAGQKEVAPPLVHKIYEPSHHGDPAFYRAAQFGVRQHHWPFGDMQPVPGVSRDDVTKIIAYVRELQRANGIR